MKRTLTDWSTPLMLSPLINPFNVGGLLTVLGPIVPVVGISTSSDHAVTFKDRRM